MIRERGVVGDPGTTFDDERQDPYAPPGRGVKRAPLGAAPATRPGWAPLAAPTTAAPEQAPAAPPPTGDERDLPAELRSALGDLSQCLTSGVAEHAPVQLTLQIEAWISATGIVTRSVASGPIESDALRCIERRATASHLRGPIPDAPRVVRTSITYDRRPVPPPDAGPPRGY